MGQLIEIGIDKFFGIKIKRFFMKILVLENNS